MLSPGKWHLQVPKERIANLTFRRNLLHLAKGNPRHQAALREACRQDLLFFINAFVFQFNPKKKGLAAIGPFLTWGFQDEALLGRPETTGTRGILWCYENNRSAVVEKSREMGATWLFLILQDWLCLFHPYVQCLNISKSADAVDCKSPDSLFWKLRFMHRHLPDWLKGPIEETKMFFGYEQTKSVNTGEASTGRAGVAGRAGVIFIDEFSKIKEAMEIRQRTANTSDCRFFNSTHEGSDTEFYKLTVTPEFVKIVMHWTQHPEKWPGAYRYNPRKNDVEVLDKNYVYPPDFKFVMSEAPLGGPFPGVRSPWYDAKCAEIGSPRGVAIELDIDPGGSVQQFFDALMIRALRETYACDPLWEGDLSYDRETGKPLGLVKVQGGPIKMWVNPKPDGTLPVSKYVAGADISTGSGATNSVFSLVDGRTGEKVLEYATPKILPERLAPICTALCWLFKDEEEQPAYFGWEHAGPGMIFGQRVIDLGYRRIYMREAHLTLAGGKVSDVPGWYPSNEQKELLLQEYRDALDMREFINRSDIALEECLDYRYNAQGVIEHPHDAKSDDPTGARVNHGDRVIADALAWKLCKPIRLTPGKRKQPEQIPVGSLAWRRQLRDNQKDEDGW